jgi:hypothetical protein
MNKCSQKDANRPIGYSKNDWRLRERGRDYAPALGVRDVPSLGLTTRILGHKTGRVHILFSELETALFYALEATPPVTDIREQFALPLEETQAIAEELAIRHPIDPKTKSLFELTTDFMITVQAGSQQVDHARTVKYSGDLAKHRTQQKLELERVFWECQGIGWGIITEKDIPAALVANSRWLHPYFTLSDSPDLTPDILDRIQRVLKPKIIAGKLSLARYAADSDDELGLMTGTSLKAVRHFLAIRQWTVDLNRPIDPAKMLVLLNHDAVKGATDGIP